MSEAGRVGFGQRNSFGTRRLSRPVPVNDDVVWINIANLPDTVLTQDLQELFEDYNVFGIGVHYDEFGAHMGTADLFVDAPSAQSIIRDFANVAIDGSQIRFAIVSEQANNSAQFARSRPKNTVPFNNRRRGQRSNSGRSSRTYSRSRSPLARERPGRVASAGGAKNNSQRAKTAEELDTELEQYMRGNKHPRIKLDS
uniref:Chromatin target of PRMT1 protein C-terminal domain-containing protein n=1 Tax=Globodera rostochiensis TaxID=31243 RepID=A0A914I732_GLORO